MEKYIRKAGPGLPEKVPFHLFDSIVEMLRYLQGGLYTLHVRKPSLINLIVHSTPLYDSKPRNYRDETIQRHFYCSDSFLLLPWI